MYRLRTHGEDSGNESRQVVSARSALLSNYEVLTLLKELESDQLSRQKTALRIKKEEEERVALAGKDVAPSQASLLAPEEVSENLRTVEFEVRPTRALTSK